MSADASMGLASDAELATAVIRAGVAGSPAAEAELCRRFGRRVRLYGRRRLRDDSAIDDLVQRVMLVVLSKLRAGAVREPDRIDSFVLGTARLVTREISRPRAFGFTARHSRSVLGRTWAHGWVRYGERRFFRVESIREKRA